jgi:myo-inositol-1(or 4)-monophosphatase
MLNKSFLPKERRSRGMTAVTISGSAAQESLTRMLAATDRISALLPAVRAAAREAGALALDHFRHGAKTSARIWSKHGGSPVTEADMLVDQYLMQRLTGVFPEAGWLSEETADDPSRLTKRHVWIVDPIDGTRAFLGGHPDWSVAIALVSDGRPVLGIVYAPAHEAMYEAAPGTGATLNDVPIAVSKQAALAEARTAGPKPLLDVLETRAGQLRRLEKIPSLALRLARVAQGIVDVGLVSSNSRDWDLAAADLIVHEAGGRLSDLDGAAPLYNRAEPIHGELAAASSRLHPLLIEAMRTPPPSTAHRR